MSGLVLLGVPLVSNRRHKGGCGNRGVIVAGDGVGAFGSPVKVGRCQRRSCRIGGVNVVATGIGRCNAWGARAVHEGNSVAWYAADNRCPGQGLPAVLNLVNRRFVVSRLRQ